MSKNRKLVPIIEAILAVIFWGGSFVATKVALREAAPVTVVWLRFAMGVVILGVAVAVRGQMAVPKRSELGYFALLGFLGITFHQWLQSTGLVTSEATTTAWIVATSPVFMALLGWLVLHEHLRLWQVAGIALAAAGVLLVVSKGDWGAFSQAGIGSVGDGLILASALNWAVFSILSRRGLEENPASRMMLFVMGFGWLFTSVLFAATQGWRDISNLTLNGWLGVAFLGIFCSGLAYIFWYDALQALPASQVGVFLYIEPLVTVVVAALLLNEPLLWAALVGGVIILVGVWLVQRENGM